MSLSKLLYILSLFGIVSLVFLSGYLVGNKSFINSEPVQVDIIGSNNFQDNNLSNIQFIDLNAKVNKEDSTTKIGELLLIRNKTESSKPQVMIRLTDLPVNYDLDTTYSTPKSMKMMLADRTVDGLDYEYQELGTINMNVAQDSTYTAEFVTNIDIQDGTIDKFERLVFFNSNGASQLPINDNSDFPSVIRSNNSPYIWSDKLNTN